MLKNCPMCDSEEVNVFEDKRKSGYIVTCTSCGTRTGLFLIKKEAIETWNMRVGEDKIWKRIEKFRESLNEENHYDPALKG